MVHFPAQWEEQEFVQIVFPHRQTDWVDYFDEAIETFVNIASSIAKYQKCLVVAKELSFVKSLFTNIKIKKNIKFVSIDSNDTWSRDFGAITVYENGRATLLDFKFNGWGCKYPSNLDNEVSKKLKQKGIFKDYKYKQIPMVLEGGSIDTDGSGVLITTTKCLCEKNRNPQFTKNIIEQKLKKIFGVKKILWLNSGALVGDDTDSHIDTLARFVSNTTIVYQTCNDQNDKNYIELKKMEQELKTFKNLDGVKYDLIPLPSIKTIYYENEQLPATYANFLIINKAVLVPIYNDPNDKKALSIFQKLFPKREIIGCDATTLIKQHGSLHCVTMEYMKPL